MLTIPKDLSDIRILISNDDSIHAKGIKVLEEIALSITPNVWVVAPENQMSGAGHSLTIHSPLRIKEYDKRHYSVYGTPTDCVLLGVAEVMKECKPDLVLSGINHGENTADDVTYSGTIAAAIEATLMQIPAIACSQDYDDERKYDWSIAREFLPKILKSLAGKSWGVHTLLNVNFPTRKEGVTPEVKVVPQGHYTYTEQKVVNMVDPRGKPYYWIGPPPPRNGEDSKRDMGVLKAGHVAVTPLSLNLTDYKALEELEGIF